MKKADPNPKANRNILLITYLAAALFVGLMVYFGWFLQLKSEDVINNSYNARLDSFADRVVRGEIKSSDGRILAETNVDEAGMKPGIISMILCLLMWLAIPPEERPVWRLWETFIS